MLIDSRSKPMDASVPRVGKVAVGKSLRTRAVTVNGFCDGVGMYFATDGLVILYSWIWESKGVIVVSSNVGGGGSFGRVEIGINISDAFWTGTVVLGKANVALSDSAWK